MWCYCSCKAALDSIPEEIISPEDSSKFPQQSADQTIKDEL